MKNKNQKTVLAGIIGTAIMTVVMMIAPMMGMPKMSPPAMLAGVMGLPIFIGWIMHFMIGIIYAFTYTYWFAPNVKMENLYISGAIFGFIVFVFAQIIMTVKDSMMPMPEMGGSVMLGLIGSLMGHLIFGIAVSKTIGQAYLETQLQRNKHNLT